MRRAVVVVAVAIPAALFVATVAGAGDGPRTGPPPAPGGGSQAPLHLQAVVGAKERQATLPQTSLRGRRLRADDAATPPSPGTAPAMSASSPLVAAPGGAPTGALVLVPGARAPPSAASVAANA